MAMSARFGSDGTEEVFNLSGCNNMVDFLSSPFCQSYITRIELCKHAPQEADPGRLYFLVEQLRAREEALQAGNFTCFLHALPTFIPGCTTLILDHAELASLSELSTLCDAIASPQCTLRHLDLNFTIPGTELNGTMPISSQSRDAHALIGDALFNNASLQSLTLFSRVCSPEHLVPTLTRTDPCSIKKLEVYLQPNSRDDHVLGILEGLAHNTISLTSLLIGDGSLNDSERQLAGTMLLTNTSLESLKLCNLSLPGEAVRMLFTSLEKNLYLNSLTLESSRGADWPDASSILDSLRVNGILSKLELGGTPLQGQNEAAIQAQLTRNKENVQQVRVLKSKASIQVRPIIARLFLCGLPYAGKTTLSRSLVQWKTYTPRSSSSTKCLTIFKEKMPKRTRGIEVSTMEKDGMKVSLWDMAGQAEYYAFHDYMFPNLSNDSSPSLFLFVWNPFTVDRKTGQEIKDERGRTLPKNLDKFRQEFKYWLRFIASKSLKSFKFRPRLLVAITRADLFPLNIKDFYEEVFRECHEGFREYIHIDMQGIFEMDARDPKEVKNLALHIFDCAELVLQQMPLVYQACDQARKEILNLVHTNTIAPLVTKDHFSFLCKKYLGIETNEMLDAVALSLNDSGDLIYFKSFELVVVDTQWFCHHIMGDLLYFDDNRFQNQGFFSLKFLEGLLESKVGTIATSKRSGSSKEIQSPKIEGEALVKLLIGFRLACPRVDNSDIFIPASLCNSPIRQVDPSRYLKGEKENNLTVMGRRMKCKDSICTFFTPGIFPLLQVTFHKILNDRCVRVELEVDVIAFACDGVRVFVELCRLEEEDCFIDILVSSRHTLDETIERVYENVIFYMEKVCAEPRGIQGVELEHFVIRPACIAELLDVRRRQAVSVKELQNALTKHVHRKGLKMTDDGIRKVIYTWQSTPFADDYVVDLLGEMDTTKVVESYWSGLSEAAREMANIFMDDLSASELPKPEFRRSQSGKEREAIFDKVCNLEKEMREGRKDIHKIEAAIQDVRNAVLPKLCKLLTFVEEGEAGKLPRMLVVTKDEGRMRKLVSAIVPGLKNVHLELLCECHREPHLVDGQHGLSFATLDDGLLKRGLPFINAFLKVAYVVVKVGAHVAAGYGESIPDFTRVLCGMADSSICDGIPKFFHLTEDGNSSSRVDYRKSQQWLFDVLSHHNCIKGDQIHAIFGLRRVKYDNARVAWVCDQHYTEGRPWPA